MAATHKTLVAGWSLTKACNLKCIHCYNASGKIGKDELTIGEAKQVADKLKRAGVAAVNFGGGECCLRPDFIELCTYLKKLGMKISYTTNGTMFYVLKPHLHLFDDIGVSIDFADQQKHDWFRGVEGTYEKAINTIKELVKRGVDTEIVTCLTHLNCSLEEMKKIHALCKELKVDYWRLNRFRANGRGIDNLNYLALTKQELKKSYEYLARYVDTSVSVPEPVFRSAFGGNYSIEGDPSGSTAFRIQTNGNVTPSVFLSIHGGNIREKSVEQILDSEIFRKIRNRKPKGKCKACPAYKHCRGGDAGASYLEYEHFDGPDPLCWLKPKDISNDVKKHVPKKWNVHEMYLCTLYVPVRK